MMQNNPQVLEAFQNLEKAQNSLRTLQGEAQQLIVNRTRLLTQFSENTIVENELNILEKDAKVYKLIGPALISVDLDDAKNNVSKRIKFLQKQLKGIDEKLDANQKQQEALRKKIADIEKWFIKFQQEHK